MSSPDFYDEVSQVADINALIEWAKSIRAAARFAPPAIVETAKMIEYAELLERVVARSTSPRRETTGPEGAIY